MKKNATVWVKDWFFFFFSKLLGNLEAHFVLRHSHLSIWHLCKRQGECIHIKMFTFHGKTTQNGSLNWTHFQVFVQSSEYCISSFYRRREPFQAAQPFSIKQEKWNDQYLPLLQASTQKPGCSSYMWQVLMLPKLQSFFGYLFLLKYKQVSCLKVPSQRPQQQGQDKATQE